MSDLSDRLVSDGRKGLEGWLRQRAADLRAGVEK